MKHSIEVVKDMRHAFFLHIGRLTAIISCCLLLTGCVPFLWPYVPAVDEYATIKPKEIDLIGTWEATPDSLDDMRSRGHYDYVTPRITILSNHTFEMKNMPDWVFDTWGASHKKLISGSGRWELFQSSKEEGGEWGINFFPKYSGAMLVNNEPPYLLEFSEGDADEGNFMDFEK
jgi:hypothetical protein